MKNKTLILTLSFCLVGLISFGQGYTFKVLANKGDNKVKSGSEWVALKTGASLNAGDQLMVSDNAYLGLVHVSGKTKEIKQAGEYSISDLSEELNTGSSSVASKYADFVLSKMSAEAKKNRLNATGSVDRSTGGSIDVYVESDSRVYNNKAIISWAKLEGENTYVVTLKNMFEDVLMSVETNDPSLTLNLTDEKIAKENIVLLSISTKDDKSISSETYAIKRLPEGDAAKIKTSLEELNTDVNEENALNKYILAGFYEENGLLIDALTCYEEAIHLAPDVASYKEAYEEFRLRNRLQKTN